MVTAPPSSGSAFSMLLRQSCSRMALSASGFLIDADFTFSPVSMLPRIGEVTDQHITASWYHWHPGLWPAKTYRLTKR